MSTTTTCDYCKTNNPVTSALQLTQTSDIHFDLCNGCYNNILTYIQAGLQS